MNLQPVITQIDTAATTIAQVLAAQNGGVLAPLNTETLLVALLDPLVSSNVYPIAMPEDAVQPSVVYQLVASQPGEVDGYRVTHTDTYVVIARATTYAAVRTLIGNILTALHGSANYIQVTDLATDYDNDKRTYRVALELEFTAIASSSQTTPAAFVYPVTEDSEPSRYDNCINQRLFRRYAVVTAGGTDYDVQADLFSALLGWQQGTDWEMTEHISSVPVEGGGGLQLWRHMFGDATTIGT